MEARCERRRGRPASASGTTNSGAAAAAAARRPGWSTTRDCAVITAACGRKHVGTRGRGGSPRPLYDPASARACGRAGVAPVCERERARARRPVGIRAALRAEQEKERERQGAVYKSDRSLPRPRRVPINPFLSVFPPTRPGDAPLQRCVVETAVLRWIPSIEPTCEDRRDPFREILITATRRAARCCLYRY